MPSLQTARTYQDTEIPMRTPNFLNQSFDQKIPESFIYISKAFLKLMPLFAIALILMSATGEVAFAQAAPAAAAQPAFSEVLSRMLPMFALVFMIYYFMIVKPQQLKIKTQTDLTASLKKGDTVVTSGGIFGRVSAIESDGVSIEVSPNVKIKVELVHIARKVELETAAGSNGSNSPVSRVK